MKANTPEEKYKRLVFIGILLILAVAYMLIYRAM